MTAPLSPAQKIVAAFNERHELCGPCDDDWVEQCIAAAIQALADQVVPDNGSENPYDDNEWERACSEKRSEILAIAAELRQPS